MILDLNETVKVGLLNDTSIHASNIFEQSTLNDFMSLGREVCREVRSKISKLLRNDNPILRDNELLKNKILHHKSNVTMLLPIKIGGFSDFYSSKEHASNLGIMFRGKDNPLMPNWLHLPVGYDARTSTVVVSGTNFKRPMGQIKLTSESEPIYDECNQLDTEVEVALSLGNQINLVNKFLLTKQVRMSLEWYYLQIGVRVIYNDGSMCHWGHF